MKSASTILDEIASFMKTNFEDERQDLIGVMNLHLQNKSFDNISVQDVIREPNNDYIYVFDLGSSNFLPVIFSGSAEAIVPHPDGNAVTSFDISALSPPIDNSSVYPKLIMNPIDWLNKTTLLAIFGSVYESVVHLGKNKIRLPISSIKKISELNPLTRCSVARCLQVYKDNPSDCH